MANAGSPPKRKSFKTPPKNPAQDPPKDLTKDPVGTKTLTKKPSGHPVPLNFTVENEFRREFKTFAVQNDLPMVELLKLSFETYKQQTQV